MEKEPCPSMRNTTKSPSFISVFDVFDKSEKNTDDYS